MPDLEQELTKLKIRTALDFPFFGTVGLLIDQGFSHNLPAPALTDGLSIIWDADYWPKLSQQERLFIHLHEIGHICLLHPVIGKEIKDLQGDNYRHELAQEASDHAVNILLHNSGYQVPREIKYCDFEYENKSFEEIYFELYKQRKPKRPKNPPGKQPEDGGGDQAAGPADPNDPADPTATPTRQPNFTENPGEWKPGSTTEVSESIAKEIEKLVTQALNGTGAGDVPGDLLRQVGYLKQRNIDWRALLSIALFNSGCAEYTWRRPHRALLQEDIIVPGTQDNERGDICFIVDTSGSMSDEQINATVDYLDQLRLTFKNLTIEVISHDAKVYPHSVIRPCEEIPRKFDLKGGGGTEFAPVTQFLRTRPEFNAIVWLTDGENFDREISFPSGQYIWLLTDENIEFRDKRYPGAICLLK